jgi:hypothetical protein
MNKLLSVVSAIGILTAVSAAQAAEVITDEQMDTVTAGAYAGVSASIQGAYTNYGSFYLDAGDGYAYADIYSEVTPQGDAPHTLSLSAYAYAP